MCTSSSTMFFGISDELIYLNQLVNECTHGLVLYLIDYFQINVNVFITKQAENTHILGLPMPWG